MRESLHGLFTRSQCLGVSYKPDSSGKGLRFSNPLSKNLSATHSQGAGDLLCQPSDTFSYLHSWQSWRFVYRRTGRSADPGETTNLVDSHPKIAEQMVQGLQKAIE